ncbi:hypothetical protein ASG25_04690 [Rhizobium sp. Leaf384]|uniref:DUF4238 domain-containing protein n=2 Tax=unclassified Rhizobium TaxID=2613769 RepID=UPI000713E5E3|nr:MULTISPECIES: DUF4238 domain-containing protein [unclassified Rhizobium]KQS77244.1 hypothetical protein ASG58_09560 [Rhizobium sp. Leaf383]KQS80833.1 hypothetical protein ASG25_04690 [Rhizobium sp. Leaf384]
MSVTRKNHYIPQWHQERFFTAGRKTHCLLDLKPPSYMDRDGTVSSGRCLFNSPTSRAFVEQDLYSTFFGVEVDDEIERKLFGDIDRRGADAIRAFCGDDQRAWHEHFEDLFEFLDIQKLRTPKGLAWLRQQYPEIGRLGEMLPSVAQNQLMSEMQSIRMLNVTAWTTGVREIVSAERVGVKFILSDHPVTVYNHAIPPSDARSRYPRDPSTALKGSQTLFPLGPDHLLILTNLEYAKDPAVRPDAKRTFARTYQSTMVSTIEFIKTRYLTDDQVAEVNFVIKARADRYVAGSRREDLYPEKVVSKSWADLRATFLPPADELYRFGGEMFASFENGDFHYQDEFGRTEKPRGWLLKVEPKAQPRPRDYCPCGSGQPFGNCCRDKPVHLRMSWTQKSTRERNVMFMGALTRLFDLERKDWDTVRREMTDDKIAQMYGLYEALWPLETDLLSLMPKPDGKMRSVYTGSLHPKLIMEFALGAPLYFGEVIIQNPFMISRTLRKDKRPTEQPRQYRGEALKTLMTFMQLMPLVEAGLVTLIPDPCDFDFHLRDQMMAMASTRSRTLEFGLSDDARLEAVMQEDMRRIMLNMPKETLVKRILETPGDNESIGIDALVEHIEQMKVDDMLAILQSDSLMDGGQFEVMKMAPNFEIAMYLAQATGAQILTDSIFRWRELQAALARRHLGTKPALIQLQREIASSPVEFPVGHQAIFRVLDDRSFREMESLFSAAFAYTASRTADNLKPNFEAQLAARFRRQRDSMKSLIASTKAPAVAARLTTAFRLGGFQDNTINRLLLMSSSEHHLHSIPMATLIERWDAGPRADNAKSWIH